MGKQIGHEPRLLAQAPQETVTQVVPTNSLKPLDQLSQHLASHFLFVCLQFPQLVMFPS